MTALASRPETIQRVGAIVDLFVSGRWVRGKSAGELGERFGVSGAAIEREAVIVSKCVDYIFGDRERLEKEIRAELRTIRDEAARVYRMAIEESDEPELQAANGALNAATKALDSIARNAGIGVPKGGDTNVQVNVGTASEDDVLRRMVAVLQNPDPVTARALQLAGYTRSAPVEAQGETVE